MAIVAILAVLFILLGLGGIIGGVWLLTINKHTYKTQLAQEICMYSQWEDVEAKAKKDESNACAKKNFQKNMRKCGAIFGSIIALGIVFVLLFIFIPWNIRTVNAGEVAVVKEWGDAKYIRTAGTYWDSMFSKQYITYSTQVQEINIDTETYSSDGQTMNIQMVVQCQIYPDKAVIIANNYGDLGNLLSRIKVVSIEKAKAILAQKPAMTIIETRAEISPAIEKSIREAITESYCVSINTVVLTDISFTDAFEKTVEDKMIAEQEKLKAQYEKEKAIIQAEQALEVAKKEAEAAIAKAQGDAEALQIMQTAWSTLSAEVKEAMLKQQFYEKWDGKLPEVLGGDYSLIFPLDSEN